MYSQKFGMLLYSQFCKYSIIKGYPKSISFVIKMCYFTKEFLYKYSGHYLVCSPLTALTTAVTVTKSPGRHESTRSPVSSHSMLLATFPIPSPVPTPSCSCTHRLCRGTDSVRGELFKGKKDLLLQLRDGHLVGETYLPSVKGRT